MDRGTFPQLYLTAIESLGAFGGAEAVDALKVALHTGNWWTVFANKKFGSAAAHALRRIGTSNAMDALREAAASGAPGARGAARAELGT
jgi:HEAT repeat protein